METIMLLGSMIDSTTHFKNNYPKPIFKLLVRYRTNTELDFYLRKENDHL